jgi:hypothetical protein
VVREFTGVAPAAGGLAVTFTPKRGRALLCGLEIRREPPK